MEQMKKAENCWCPSYNDAARVLGLSLPIKLGRFTTDGFDDYFWYIEGKYSPKFMPLFRSTDMDEFRYWATSGNNYQLTALQPGSYFPDNHGKIYYYDADDLSIYYMVNFLSISSVAIFAKSYGLSAVNVALAKLVDDDCVDEKCVWLLQQVDTDEDFAPVVMLPVFEEDRNAILKKEWRQENIHVLCKGDTIVHDDNLYKVGLNPQEGFMLEAQRIDFDFNSLFKT